MGTSTETSTVPDQAVNSGEEGPSAIPGTVQRRILDSVVNSRSENGKKSIKWRINFRMLDCVVTLLFSPLWRFPVFFVVGSRHVGHGASGDQQLSLREYGGMSN